ncbi:MAG: BlaI/MecI/CopY family transcriptional regulator [Clostridia bacterium]|nr:BlaI/MecI/CopY family transcriptional regulator [Clostridia bacterium]MBR5448167.1 BlaI/MecI/CopY family transcriptional regulator [Clostridia bacterium]MBR5633300.1 BlaI/MecI/CopY family transcriptional regulator [Clostridia bacterium]
MSDYQMGTVEARFADIIWEREPLTSAELVKISAEEFEWKKSTTYTVLKRLCEKGIFKNEGGMVSSVITKEEFYAAKSEQFVEESFGGSLPAFIAAFTKRKALSKSELDALRKMVDEYEEESK